MKFAIVLCLLLAVVTAIATALPRQRLQRDVSELPAYSYAPAEAKYALPDVDTTITAEAHAHAHVHGEAEADADASVDVPIDSEVTPISAALGARGYEYRTVRRHKYRQRARRDVSHLSPTYLPPVQAYLPPTVDADDTDVVNAVEPKVASVYLAPVTEEVTTSAPIVVEEDVETESPAVEETPQESAILLDDGYHYKQPAAEMPLPKAAESEYLPPLEQGQINVEGPEESAVFADDGYHYRAIKRL